MKESWTEEKRQKYAIMASEKLKNNSQHFKNFLESNIGEKNNKAKLTNTQALEIYNRVWAGERGVNLAKEFCVKSSQISAIKHKREWKNIHV